MNFTDDNKLVESTRLFEESLDYVMRNKLKITGCDSIRPMTSSEEAIITYTIGNIWHCSRFHTTGSRNYSRSQLNMSSLFYSKKANITVA